MGFNKWLLERIFLWKRPDRKGIGFLEAWVSIVGNIILFIVKFLFGLRLNSVSLQADAFHSLSDVLTSIIVLLGFGIGSKPPDKEHPFGHGRVEEIATLVIAILLLLVSYDLGKTSIIRIIHPQPVETSISVVLFMVISGLFKEWMARFSIFLGLKVNSDALIADAWHHRSDAIASVLVGIGLIMVRYGYSHIDGILGLGVVALLIWVGIDLVKRSVDALIGKAPDRELLDRIKDAVLSVPGVLNLHDIIIHDYHNDKFISLHIEVEDDLTAKKAHSIALEVQDLLKEQLKTANISVHIDPKGERED